MKQININALTKSNHSLYTLNLSDGKIQTLIQELKTKKTLNPNLKDYQITSDEDEIFNFEYNKLLSHIESDLATSENLVLQTLKSKDENWLNLQNGIYRNITLKAKIAFNNEEIEFYFNVPILKVNNQNAKKFEIIVPIFSSSVKTKTAILNQYLHYLINHSILKDDINVRYFNIDYHRIQDVNYNIDYNEVNTFSVVDTPTTPSNLWRITDLKKNVDNCKNGVEKLDDEQLTYCKNLIDMYLTKRFTDTFFIPCDFSYVSTRKVKKVVYVVDDNTYVNLTKEIKNGKYNGAILQQSKVHEITDDVLNYNDLSLFNSYTLSTNEDKNAIKKYEKVQAKINDEIKIDNEIIALHLNHDTNESIKLLLTKTPAESDYLYDDFDLMQALYKTRVKDNMAYCVYEFANNIFDNSLKYELFQMLNDYQTTKNIKLNTYIDVYVAFNSFLNDNSLNLSDKLQVALTNYLKMLKPIDKEIQQYTNTIYGTVNVDSWNFMKVYENNFKNKKLLHYDFESVDTYLNCLKNKLGKTQLVSQLSMITTDENLNIVNKADNIFLDNHSLNANSIQTLSPVDIVLDPLDMSATYFKYIIDALYYRLKNYCDFGVVYNKAFEATRLVEMISYLDEIDVEAYQAKVDFINARTVDLMDFYYKTDYHLQIIGLKGKYSIKDLEKYPKDKAFDAYNENLSTKYNVYDYSNLDINNGNFAKLKTTKRLVGLTSSEIWNNDAKALAIYCKNDCANMIKQIANLDMLYHHIKQNLTKTNSQEQTQETTLSLSK